MEHLSARLVLVLLSFLAAAIAWSAGAVRERLGWTSVKGQVGWLILGFPIFLVACLGQILIYRRMAGTSPFDDSVATTALIAQGVVGLIIVFYYVWKHDRAPQRGQR
jgi:hypothetical protein